jgi:DNA repair protein RecO (recombination protein O)
MEETYNIQAIILNRRPSGEGDSRVTVYSRESGKLELTARGAKKMKSKLAGHLEPVCLTDIMVVRGRRHDYVGAAVSANCFGKIKNDLSKLALAGRAVKIVNQLTKPGVVDEKIFELLKNYLEFLDTAKKNLAVSYFILKFLTELGHRPELAQCLNCAAKIQPGKNRFDLARGGLVCGRCAGLKNADQFVISDDGIKLLRLTLKSDFKQLEKVKVSKKLEKEAGEVIEKFLRYNFN